MDWNKVYSLRLINLFRDKEWLWNPSNLEYKNRQKRYEALSEISKEFGTESADVERKWKNLTSHYFREKKKCEDSKGTGAEYASKWFAFNAMEFLQNRTKIQNSDMNYNVDSDNSLDISYPKQNDFQPPIKKGRKRTRCAVIVPEAVNIMKHISQIQKKNKDDAALFGDYVAEKLRNMSNSTKSLLQHRISNLIFEAEMGYLTPGETETITVASDVTCYGTEERDT